MKPKRPPGSPLTLGNIATEGEGMMTEPDLQEHRRLIALALVRNVARGAERMAAQLERIEAQLDRIDARMRCIDNAMTELVDAFRAYRRRVEDEQRHREALPRRADDEISGGLSDEAAATSHCGRCFVRSRSLLIALRLFNTRVVRRLIMPKQPPSEPMTLGNMRKLGVQRLVATCLNDACRHQKLIDVSKFPDDRALVYQQDRVREVWRAWSAHRHTAELERATDAAEPDREAVALSLSQTEKLLWCYACGLAGPSGSCLADFLAPGGAQCRQPIVCFVFASRLSSSASFAYSASTR